jgi:MoxR-like ATPase
MEAGEPTLNSLPSPETFEAAQHRLLSLQRQLEGVLVGQQALIRDLLTALFAGGHVLIEGLPGLGKTALARSMASLLGLRGARVQCTPDLLPADISGAEVLEAGGGFSFRPGPVFAQLLLVDEINRATPRTQSALLEAMQEGQVTAGGQTHALPRPFCVIATQNPIELEGTYPLPEAQLDRFLFKLQMPTPTREVLLGVLAVSLDGEPSDALQAQLDPEAVLALMALARQQLVGERCRAAAVDLVMATQPGGDSGPQRHLRYGASPRALQALVRAARVRSLFEGRPHVDIDDLAAVALPVLRHRVLLRLDSELDGLSTESLLVELIEAWRRRA